MYSRVRVFIASIILFYGSFSYAGDPCSLLNSVKAEVETKDGFIGTIGRIYSRIHDLLDSEYFEELNDNKQGIYFTRQPGFYFTLDCSMESSKRRLGKIGMFGVGDTFKPLRKRTFSNEVYYYGITRSGLLALVREKDLRKMNNGDVYFFNRTSNVTNFCTNKVNCDGKSKEFSSRSHYAVTSIDNYMKENRESKCVDMNVSIYKGTNNPSRSGLLTPEYKYAQLSYCEGTHDNGVFSNYKKKAEDDFKNLPVTGQYLILSSKSLRDKIPFIFTRKDCQTKKTIKKNTVISLGGSIAKGVDFIIKGTIEGEAEIKIDISDEEVFSENNQYLYQNYTRVNGSNPLNDDSKKTLNDIVITQTCDGTSVPTKLNEIRINVSPEEDKLISIDIPELDKVARERFSKSGVWRMASSSSRVRGHTWLIAGLEQNMQWKDYIFDRIYKELNGVLPDEIDTLAKYNYTNYYVSLFMATAFEYVSKEDSVDDRILRGLF